MGLSTPVTRPHFLEHVQFWEAKALELREENLKMVADRAKLLVAKEVVPLFQQKFKNITKY